MKIAFVVTLSLLCAAVASGQVAYTYRSNSPGSVDDIYLPSAAVPSGAPSGFPPLSLAGAAGLGTPIGDGGGMAIDQLQGCIYTTDGVSITIDFNPIYSPFTAGPGPLGPVTVTLPQFFGPITGLAIDSATGTLWASDPFCVVDYPLLPPFVPLGAPILLNFVATPPVTGLGFDAATGSLWCCDAGNNIYEFGTNGMQIGTTVSIPSLFGLSGLAVNSSNGPGSFPPPVCSTQTPSAFGVMVTDGIALLDVFGTGAPITLPTMAGGATPGLAYSSDYQVSVGTTGCITSGAFPIAGTTFPVVTGQPGDLALAGAPPMVTATGWFDLCPIPGGANLPVTGETLWINPTSPFFDTFGVVTDAGGLALLPFTVPPGAGLAGIQFSFQYLIPDIAHPFLNCLSDAATVTIGVP